MAQAMPDALAVVEARPRGAAPAAKITFRELDETADHIAGGLQAMGVRPERGSPCWYPPASSSWRCVFALFKTGAVHDPDRPRNGPEEPHQMPARRPARRLRCHLDGTGDSQLLRGRFPAGAIQRDGRASLVLGRPDARRARRHARPPSQCRRTRAIQPRSSSRPAAPARPRACLYRHGNFDRAGRSRSASSIGIAPGEIDLACFPLFGLFNRALGVTTVIPDMDASRPAQVDPSKIVAAIDEWKVTQSFGSPAIWNRVGR